MFGGGSNVTLCSLCLKIQTKLAINEFLFSWTRWITLKNFATFDIIWDVLYLLVTLTNTHSLWISETHYVDIANLLCELSSISQTDKLSHFYFDRNEIKDIFLACLQCRLANPTSTMRTETIWQRGTPEHTKKERPWHWCAFHVEVNKRLFFVVHISYFRRWNQLFHVNVYSRLKKEKGKAVKNTSTKYWRKNHFQLKCEREEDSLIRLKPLRIWYTV